MQFSLNVNSKPLEPTSIQQTSNALKLNSISAKAVETNFISMQFENFRTCLISNYLKKFKEASYRRVSEPL